MNTYSDNTYSIGRTPLVRINKLCGSRGAEVYAKIEGRNPCFSVKCRIGASMIWDAEERGVLKKGMEIIEPTSGNTGIALAYSAAARGYKVKIVMPDTMSIERRKILKAFGAELVLTDGVKGMAGAISEAESIAAEAPERYFMPQQFKNPANPAIHEKTTGPEIWEDTDHRIDCVVAGVGTGGTITGISRYIKNTCGKAIKSIAVEPAGSPVLTQTLAGKEVQPGPHMIQGIGAGFVPETLDLSMVDAVELVQNEEAIEFARRLTREEGIFAGISCGAAMAVAARLSARAEYEGKVMVVICPDAGERYMSTMLFE